MPHEESLRRAFIGLAAFPDVGAAVCLAAAHGSFVGDTSLHSLCSTLGISQGRAYQVQGVLDAGSAADVFQQISPLSWAPKPGVDYAKLGQWLQGAHLYLTNVHEPTDEVSVVLTRPPSPARLESVLADMGHRAMLFENTGEVFTNIAGCARERLLVLTPFIDFHGAQALLAIFQAAAPGVKKQLIFRGYDGVLPQDLADIGIALRSLGVALFNYWIPKGQKGFYETFHAKVVLADNSRCYVGSANMTNASFAYSVELGFLVQGAAAHTVSWVCDAIQKIAVPQHY